MTERREPKLLRLGPDLEIYQLNAIETRYLYHEIYVDKLYGGGEPLDLPANAFVVDAGANIGLFARYVLDAQPSARLLCIEPAPSCLDVLAKNIAPGAGVTIVPVALGVADGRVEFSFLPNYTMMSSSSYDRSAAEQLITEYTRSVSRDLSEEARDDLLEALPAILSRRLEPETIWVDQSRLDRLIEECGNVDSIDFLKVDVEGAEVDVLAGLGDYGFRVQRAAVEVEGAAKLGMVRDILLGWKMDVVVHQQPHYAGTELFIVLASR